MQIERAIRILTEYNDWRRGDHEPCDFKYSSLELGAAIDVAIHSMYRLGKIQQIVFFGEGGTDGRD